MTEGYVKVLASSLFLSLCVNQYVEATKTADEVKYPGIIAKVGDEIITSSDLDKSVDLTSFIAGGYSSDVHDQIVRDTLGRMISDLLKWRIVQKFSPSGGWVSDDEVDAQIANIAKENSMSVEQFCKALRVGNIDLEVLRTHIKVNVSWSRYIEARYGKNNISNFELQSLEKRMKASTNKALYEFRRAFFPIHNSQDEASVMAAVRSKADMIDRGADFTRIVDQINANVEVVPENLLSQNVKQALSKARVGKCCIVKENDGVWLILLKDKYVADGFTTKIRVVQIAIPDREEHPTQEDLTTQMNFAKNLVSSSKGIDDLIENAQLSGICGVSKVTEVVLEQFQFNERQVLSSTPAGHVTPPIRTAGAVSLFCVLSKETRKIPVPTLQELTNMERNRFLNKCSEAELLNERKKCDIKVYERPAHERR